MINVDNRANKWRDIISTLDRIHSRLIGESYVHVLPTNRAGYTQVKLFPANRFDGSNYSEEFRIPMDAHPPSVVMMRNEAYTLTPHEDYICQVDQLSYEHGSRFTVKISVAKCDTSISSMELIVDKENRSSLTINVSRKPVP